MLSATLALWLSIIFVAYTVIGSSKWNSLSYQEVLIAANTIPRGTVITPEMLTVTSFVQGNAPHNSFSINNSDEIIGSIALVTINPGDIISPSFVGFEGGDSLGKLSEVIEPNRKIVTVSVSDVHTIPEVLRVGDRVTIYKVDVETGSKSILIGGVEVLQVLRKQSDDEDSIGSIVSISVSITDEIALDISEALAKDNFLHLAIEPRV